ncbi:hypothetical protein ACJMK2_041799, partial [Sinanodonta woodiana]
MYVIAKTQGRNTMLLIDIRAIITLLFEKLSWRIRIQNRSQLSKAKQDIVSAS